MHFFLGCDKNQEEGSAVNLLTQINQLEHLTSNEKSLCDYIRNHPMECLSKTPQQLAGDLYLSTSTVYRLLKKLDLKGYSDFKVALWTVVHQKSESAVPSCFAHGPSHLLASFHKYSARCFGGRCKKAFYG